MNSILLPTTHLIMILGFQMQSLDLFKNILSRLAALMVIGGFHTHPPRIRRIVDALILGMRILHVKMNRCHQKITSTDLISGNSVRETLKKFRPQNSGKVSTFENKII